MNPRIDDSTVSLDIDLANPGQFLACCGLLELASKLDPDATGWFAGRRFHLAAAAPELLEQFIRCKISAVPAPIEIDRASDDDSTSVDAKEPKSPPVYLGEPFNFRLDWWDDDSAIVAGFKTWSAGMTILGFFNGTVTGKRDRQKRSPGMREHLARHLSAGSGLLQLTEAIEKPSPFNFDSRISRNVALDLGFVGHVVFAFSPAVELLALVGLQRFRPRMVIRWDRNIYYLWRDPLPVGLAAAASHGLIPTLVSDCYAFPVKPRDAQGRYKAFGSALPERNSDARSAKTI